MQSRRTIQAGLALAAGVLLMATVVRSQQTPAVGPVWDYASTTSSVGQKGIGVTICSGGNGCQSQLSSDNMMAAASKLGEKGWELASVGDDSASRTLYFKRLRSVIHKND